MTASMSAMPSAPTSAYTVADALADVAALRVELAAGFTAMHVRLDALTDPPGDVA